MAGFNKFHPFVQELAHKGHNLSSDTLKVMLTNSSPIASNGTKGNLAEISTGNGYPAGGIQASIASSGQTSGLYRLILGDVTFTASGGSFGPARYAVLYNDTSASKTLIGYWDYGSSLTINAGESFTWDADQVAGVLTLS